jgi:hypothetical protein
MGLIDARGGQRRYAPLLLTTDPQRFATRRQDAQHRASGRKPSREFGAGVNQVLAIVEHEQEGLALERVR